MVENSYAWANGRLDNQSEGSHGVMRDGNQFVIHITIIH